VFIEVGDKIVLDLKIEAGADLFGVFFNHYLDRGKIKKVNVD
jgi:hypothetical protein